MDVQPTAISRHREKALRGSRLAYSGRPVKRQHPEPDCNVTQKRGEEDNIKRKHNLQQNETKNQSYQF